ncbi:hypothetical protein [Nostoc sp.]|uniref:hypothetical protein n=1 Tax=Nostoc sp. TaxID=1180 RepID=UPI002FF603F9
MKYSPQFERDYQFYLKNAEKFNFAPYQPIVEVSDTGKDAKHCFWRLDSTGKLLPCSEPELLRSLLICKKSLGFHLKMWAEGFEEMGEEVDYYMSEFISPPKWVRVALEKAISKHS